MLQALWEKWSLGALQGDYSVAVVLQSFSQSRSQFDAGNDDHISSYLRYQHLRKVSIDILQVLQLIDPINILIGLDNDHTATFLCPLRSARTLFHIYRGMIHCRSKSLQDLVLFFIRKSV